MVERNGPADVAPWLRVLLTVLLVGLTVPLGGLLLPGIDPEQLEQMLRLADQEHGGADSSFGIFALGLRPMISGFAVTEFAALIWPAWRSLRTDGLNGRKKLRVAALAVALALALVQGFFVARFLNASTQLSPQMQILSGQRPVGWELLSMLTLAGGVGVLWVVAGIIDRVGLGGGVSVLLSFEALRELGKYVRFSFIRSYAQGERTHASVAIELILVAIIALSAWLFLRSPQRASQSENGALLHQPLTGIVPLISAPSLIMLIAGDSLTPSRPTYLLVYFAILAALCVIFSWGFSLPEGRWRPDSSSRLRAALLSACFILLLALVNLRSSAVLGVTPPSPVWIVILVAVTMDIISEWRARSAYGALDSVWISQSVPAAAWATDLLGMAGIPACVRSLNQRCLWRIFGAGYELHILVPSVDTARAQRILGGEESPSAQDVPAPDERTQSVQLRGRGNSALVGCVLLPLPLLIGTLWPALQRVPDPVLRLVYGPASVDGRVLDPGRESTPSLDGDVAVCRQRLIKLGVRGGHVQSIGNRLYVDLPLLPDEVLSRVKQFLHRPARLEFRAVDSDSPYPRRLASFVENHRSELPDIEVRMTTWTSSDGVQHEEQYVQSTSQQRLKWLFQNLPSDYSPEKDRELVLSESTEDTDGQPTKIWRSYYVERAAVLTNESIEEAETQYTADGRVGVSLSFDAAGAARFAAHTETHVGRKLAIMFEGVVRSAPVVEGKISGGRASISLGASVDPAAARREAEDLVAILRAGQLPVPLILVGEHRLPSP